MRLLRIFLLLASYSLVGCVSTQTYSSFTYGLREGGQVQEMTDIARSPAETAIHYSATAPVIFDVRLYDSNKVLFSYTGTSLDRPATLPQGKVVWLRWRLATQAPAVVTYYPAPNSVTR